MRKRWIHLVVVLAILSFVTACTCQPEVKPVEVAAPAPPPPPAPKVEAPPPPPPPPVEVKEEAPPPPKPVEEVVLEDIFFALDKHFLTDEAKATLERNAAKIKNNPDLKVRIEGSCDERATNKYNMALGEKRANSAKKYLIGLGVKEDQLSTVSYGEEKPSCTEKNEECWAKNRRDHFAIVK
jgi:peptidoglycan-associated lipoprotein